MENGTYALFKKQLIKFVFNSGYQIGLTTNLKTLSNVKQLYKSIKYIDFENYIGVWKDENTNIIEYDISIHVDNLDMAKQIAINFNQKCIYDWKNDKLIWLK